MPNPASRARVRPAVYHRPVCRPIVRHRQDVQPGQAAPGSGQAARQHGGGPLFGDRRHHQRHRMEPWIAVADGGQGRGEPVQEVVAQDGAGAEHHLDQEGAVFRRFDQYAADTCFEIVLVAVHLVHPGTGIRQVGNPGLQTRHARRPVAHQFTRLDPPVGATAPGSPRDHLLQARARLGVHVDVRLRQRRDRRCDPDVRKRRYHKAAENAGAERGQGVAGVVADGESETFQLAHVALERGGFHRYPRRQARGSRAGIRVDQLEGGAGPRPNVAACVHVTQPVENGMQGVRGDVRGHVGHRSSRIRQVVEPNLEHGFGMMRGSRREQLPQQGVPRREPGRMRRGIGDPSHGRFAHLVHRHHAVGVEPIPVAHPDAGALPGPVGDGNRAVRDSLVKRVLEQHQYWRQSWEPAIRLLPGTSGAATGVPFRHTTGKCGPALAIGSPTANSMNGRIR